MPSRRFIRSCVESWQQLQNSKTSSIIDFMRISISNLEIILKTFKTHFGPHDHLWVFGSRVIDSQRGGDIDLYIETHENAVIAIKRKTAFINDLWRIIGEQKIDIVIHTLSEPELPIHQIAKQTGVKIT